VDHSLRVVHPVRSPEAGLRNTDDAFSRFVVVDCDLV